MTHCGPKGKSLSDKTVCNKSITKLENEIDNAKVTTSDSDWKIDSPESDSQTFQ